jgi:hypothetical protein
MPMITIVSHGMRAVLMKVEGNGFDPNNLPPSQMRHGLPEAFQPHMLAALEKQCRDFMA